ncbi:MAG: hypothetical protein LBU58_02975 [Clostridiales bacterium]|jgi:hypothetical protein|nr:hypothetical protein [Clostridiales bacterium]
MLDMTVTYRDLGLLAVFFVIVVAGIFLIRALAHLGGILSETKKLFKDNAEGIDKLLKTLPELTENAATLSEQAIGIAEALSREQEMAEDALFDIGETVGLVADTARTIHDDVFEGVKKLAGLIAALIGLFTGKKGKSEAAPGEGGAGPAGVGADVVDSAGKSDAGGAAGKGASVAQPKAGSASAGEVGGSVAAGAAKPARHAYDRRPIERRSNTADARRGKRCAATARKRRNSDERNINIHIR